MKTTVKKDDERQGANSQGKALNPADGHPELSSPEHHSDFVDVGRGCNAFSDISTTSSPSHNWDALR